MVGAHLEMLSKYRARFISSGLNPAQAVGSD